MAGAHESSAAKADSPKGTTPKKKATKPGWDEQLTGPDKKAELNCTDAMGYFRKDTKDVNSTDVMWF